MNRWCFVGFILRALILQHIHNPSNNNAVNAFQWDVDTAKDDYCSKESIEKCRTDDNFHFVCSHTCTAHYNANGVILTNDNPDDFYDLKVTKANGKTLEMEDLEGYVTMFIALPLYPGMAKYWMSMLDHIQKVFPYTLETIILPVIPKAAADQNNEKTNVPDLAKENRSNKLILLKETDDAMTNAAVKLMLPLKAMAGFEQTDMLPDRVNVFIISSDGRYVERMVHPSRLELEKRINVYFMQLQQQQQREL